MENININDILGIDSTPSQSNNKNITSATRYPALRTIAVVYLALAWLIGFAAIIGGSYLLIEGNRDAEILTGAISIVVGLLAALGLAAISESIKVFLDIEYNTRKTSEK